MKEYVFAELAVYTCSCFNQLTHQQKEFFFAKTLENSGLTKAHTQKKLTSTALLSNKKKTLHASSSGYGNFCQSHQQFFGCKLILFRCSFSIVTLKNQV